MKYLHPYLYEIIHDLVEDRVAQKKFPFVAIENDIKARIMADVSTALDEMTHERLIARSSNVNGIGLYRHLKQEEGADDKE